MFHADQVFLGDSAMKTKSEQKDDASSELKARERDALNRLFGESQPIDIYGLLEEIFKSFKNLQELPRRIESLKLFPVSYLSLSISPERLISTRKAIDYLYPKSDWTVSKLQEHFFPLFPTFALTSALFRMWAVLSSEKLKRVINALVSLDISELIQEQESEAVNPKQSEYKAFNEITSCLRILKASKADVSRLFKGSVVSMPSAKELELIAKNKKCRVPPIGYESDLMENIWNQVDHQLVLCIDPYNEVSDILEIVREIIEAHHKEMKALFDHQKEVPRGIGYFNLLKHPFKVFEEMDFFLPNNNIALFNEIDPLQYFQLKEKGDKSRDLQTVTDDNFHALITYDLRKCDIRPVDIERRFFGLVAAPKTNTYKAKTKAHNDRYKRALRLIDRALACAPIQS